jgi:tyrosyl-tRNA synthetase
MSSALLADLRARGLVFQVAGEESLPGWLDAGSRTLYAGFDPTADSLHIGSLVPLLMLRRFQLAGHRPIALVGGATGLVGDPSFKAQERQLNTPEVVGGWVDSIREQVSAFLDFDAGELSARVVNNLDWTAEVWRPGFPARHWQALFRQRHDPEGVGKAAPRAGGQWHQLHRIYLHDPPVLRFRRAVSPLRLRTAARRLRSVGQYHRGHRPDPAPARRTGLRPHDASDHQGRWQQIRQDRERHCLAGPRRTSPYAFYQFWLSVADEDVYRFLRYFTFLEVAEIDAIERADRERAGKPEAQGVLAAQVTKLVHGQEGLAAAQRITESLFSGATSVSVRRIWRSCGWMACQPLRWRPRPARDADAAAVRGRGRSVGQAGEGRAAAPGGAGQRPSTRAGRQWPPIGGLRRR